MRSITLNTIKNKINQFPISTSMIVYLNKKDPDFYILCTNISPRTQIKLNNWNYSRDIKAVLSYEVEIYKYVDLLKYTGPSKFSLETFIKLNSKDTCKGLLTKEDFSSFVNLKEIESNIFTSDGDLTFNLNQDYIYLFIRLNPLSNDDLNGLIMYLNNPNVYLIKERSNINQIRSLGFIIKLNNRYFLKEINYSDSWSNINMNPLIKYNISKQIINKNLFDNTNFSYRLSYSMLYIQDLNILNKYNLNIITNV